MQKSIYGQIAQERDDLRDKGTNPSLGLGSWRSYDLDFRTPFPEVDTLRLSVAFDRGAGHGETIRIPHRRIRVDPHSRPRRVRGPR